VIKKVFFKYIIQNKSQNN